jgi:inner membrane protein
VVHASTGTRSRLPMRDRLLLGAAAAAFPDIDFAAFPIDPLRFLADWHQGPTHSIVLLPLWALLIGAAYVGLSRRRDGFTEAASVSALGVASHIAADLITAYGTAVFYPLSAARPSLATTFVIDPLFTAIVLLGLALSLRRVAPKPSRALPRTEADEGRRAAESPPRLHARPSNGGDADSERARLRQGGRLPAAAALAVLCLYVGAQAWLQQRAVELGRASLRAGGIAFDSVAALPQPFSPFNWKLVAVDGGRYHEAHVNLAGHPPLVPALPGLRGLHEIAAAYVPPARLAWQVRHRHGEGLEQRAIAERLWNEPRFEPFRRFAIYPALSGIDEQGARMCVWFTDLRYDLPRLPDTFRYGFCRDGAEVAWQLHRLRYFTERSAQRL